MIENIDIFLVQAHAKDKRYGRALNRHIELLPDNAWIVVRDLDTLPFGDNLSEILEQAIIDNPDAQLFTCATNRAYGQQMLSETDMLWHYKEAVRRSETKKYTVIKGVVPAFFWMFNKSLWEKYPFDDMPIIANRRSFDTRWTKNMEAKRVRIDHLYLFHFYRLHKDKKDYSHLL